MNPSIESKLEHLTDRREEISALLSDPSVLNDQNHYRKLSIEYSDIGPVVELYQNYKAQWQELESARAMLEDADKAMQAMAREEIARLQPELEKNELKLQKALLPKDPNDDRNLFLEIRAGTGGDEAALFAGDLFRMYSLYAERHGWKIEIMSQGEGDHGGYKEIISRVAGDKAYSRLKFESGAHRVQRVPETEAQGRIHTSACTVAVLPEADAIDEVELNPQDLRVDTYRAAGAGGQHVNKTDSAVRITHLPTGMVVECQEERSQHKNRARAMSILQSRLKDAEVQAQQQEEAANRKLQVGSGDRSERIRTYNFPQGRVTDHRINLTLYKLEDVMGGDLDQIIEPLITEHQAEQLASLGAA